MIFHRSLSDSNSSQVSGTLLSILINFNNAVVWIFSTRSLISKSSNPCTNHLVTVTRAPITIGITVTFMFHCFSFSSLASIMYLSLFPFFYSFILWSAGTAKSTIWQVSFFVLFCFLFLDYHEVWSSGRD